MSKEEPLKVSRIVIEGEKFLIDKRTDILYDEASREAVGVFNRETKEIQYYDEEDDDEEDEEEDDDDEEDEEEDETPPPPPPKKKEKEPVKQIPYPEDLQFTEKELTIFNKDRSEINSSAREYISTYLRGNTGRVIMYGDKEEGEVIAKRALQMDWDKGYRTKEQEFEVQKKEYIKKLQRYIEIINIMTTEYQQTKDKALREEIKKAKALLKIVEEEYGNFRQAENNRLDELQKEEEARQAIIQEQERKRAEKQRIEDERKEKQRLEDAKLLYTPEKVKELVNEKDSWVTIIKSPFLAVRWLDFTKDKDPYGGSLNKVKNLEYFKPKRLYKVWGSNDLIDPDTLEVIGEFVEDRNDFKLHLTELGLQRLEEYKSTDEEKLKEQEAVAVVKPKEALLKPKEENQELQQNSIETDYKKAVKEFKLAKTGLAEAEQNLKDATESDNKLQISLKKNALRSAKDEWNRTARRVKELQKLRKEGTGINNPELYEKAKKIADETYKKPSAYKSGFIVKKYKELGGTYSDDGKPKELKRWFKEEWKDIGNKEYPVYRPTKRITKDTPLTATEIDPKQAKKQIVLKQEIKGDANLPPFQEKTGGKVVALGVQAEKIPKQDEVWKWSNPVKVAEMARKYLGDMAVVFRSTKPKKKYMIFDPINNKWVFFGEIGYEDFTKHQDPKRKENYLTRTANMKGNWKNNRYSANNLSRNILW